MLIYESPSDAPRKVRIMTVSTASEGYRNEFIREQFMGTPNVPEELVKLMGSWRYDTPVLIDAGTGTGKSTFIIECLLPFIMENGGSLLIVDNRRALTLQYKHVILQRYSPQVLRRYTLAGLEEKTGLIKRFHAMQAELQEVERAARAVLAKSAQYSDPELEAQAQKILALAQRMEKE